MFNILILLVLSAVAGYALRKYRRLRIIISYSTTVTILSLLFVFGMSIGSNESIIANLHNDGLKAAVIAVFGVAGSISASFLYRRFDRKEGRK